MSIYELGTALSTQELGTFYIRVKQGIYELGTGLSTYEISTVYI